MNPDRYDRPEVATYEPTTIYSAADLSPIPSEGERIVGYREYAGMLVPILEARPEPIVYQPRDLTPQPLIDPRAQLIVAGGIGAGAAGAGIGWGVGQAAAGIAAIGSSSAFIVAALLLAAAKLTSGGASSTTQIHNETHINNHNRWWGRSTTSSR